MTVYSGDIQIEDDDFQLKANQFIIRENEYSFSFSGTDDSGDFNLEGLATKSEAGFYMASKMDLNYTNYADTDNASIRLDAVELSQTKDKCLIKGIWIQDEDNWSFSATLERFKNIKVYPKD